MKTFLVIYLATLCSVMAIPPPSNHSPLPIDACHFYLLNGGVAKTLTNKHWVIQKVYADSIPLPDSLFVNVQYLFDQNGEFVMLSNVQNLQPDAKGFDYTINEATSTIQVKTHETNTLLTEFHVICLNQGHLAFYYDTPTDNPNKIVRLEFRFLVDYTWENKIIQEALKNPNQ